MMHRASGLFGLAALVLAFMGPGADNLARAEDDERAKQLSDQLATFVGVPFQSSDDPDVAPTDDDAWFVGNTQAEPLFLSPDQNLIALTTWPEATQDAEAPLLPGEDTGQPTVMSWSFAGGDNKAAATTKRPFLMDLPSEAQTFSVDTETAYDAPAEKSSEPHDFRISDSLKVKAQPTGGGLGGRVTLTFTFPTGY